MKTKYVFLIFYIYYISMLRHFIGIYWNLYCYTARNIHR